MTEPTKPAPEPQGSAATPPKPPAHAVQTANNPPPEEPREPINPSGWRGMIDSLLRQPEDLAEHAALDDLKTMRRFGIIALLTMAVFGVVLGTFAQHEQLWAAPLKLMTGLVFAAVICFPSLFIFSGLAGSSVSVTRLATLMSAMMALTGMLLLGFAPAVWIFTQSTRSFGFMGLLGLAAWLIALLFSFRFLTISLRKHKARQDGPIFIWCVVFLLVTLQLTTSLRPILGRSDKFLTGEKKFFIQHWAESGIKELPEAGKKKQAEEKQAGSVPKE